MAVDHAMIFGLLLSLFTFAPYCGLACMTSLHPKPAASGDLSHGFDEARQGRADISADPFAMTFTNGSRSFDALDPFRKQ
jgi:hypothetical protein